MSDSEQLYRLLAQIGAVISNSHVVYTSGRHGSAYINKDAIYPHAGLTRLLCRKIADHFRKHDIEVVLGPALGGIILSQWVSHQLSEQTTREILGVYADKTEGSGFVIKRGYDKLITRKNVLIVEDVLNTGGSVKNLVESARRLGANIVAVAALCNRGAVTSEMIGQVPELYSLIHVSMESWEENDCPLCIQKIPINTTVGKGLEFVSKR
ncbi:MAG: phosphoribosyltransferase [Deltaproteobacteria bacterium]|nr:phosphoribosyltransferase [Deltaproteobacteria bacterium]